MKKLDFRAALNAASDVVQNRPRPLREFDQIYMKVGDLVIQADFIARKYDKKKVVFVGDGDAIALSVMHMKKQGVFEYGPESIHLLDFDERAVHAARRFSEKHEIAGMTSELYNVADALPAHHIGKFDAFYTNPPWGASNDGASVIAFVRRGVECVGKGGLGAIVIGDHENYPWTQVVLRNTQQFAIEQGFVVCEMIPGLHTYHLDDSPDLTSCSLMIRRVEDPVAVVSKPLDREELERFYGKKDPLKVRYVRDKSGLDPEKEAHSYYELEPMEKSP